MAKYRKTALVEAEQFLPPHQIPEGCYQKGNIGDVANGHGEWCLKTLEGEHELRAADYVCTGPAGERWNVEKKIFEATYELAALTASPPVVEREAKTVPIIEEARAKYREPTDWDYGALDACTRIERAILALPDASTTPVAQGDEVRGGIYVASRASIPERGQMWRDLRAVGVQINSSWIDEDGEGETADWSELWTRIEGEVKRSKALVLYAEPSDFPLKGAFVEAGMALAAGIPVFIVAPGVELGSYGCRPIGSWASHPLVTYAETIGDALATLTKGARDAG